MVKLNLVYPENSDITFKKQSFPDGQQNIVLDELEFPFENGVNIQIKSRLNNWRDLELISCAVACLRQEELKREVSVNIHLYTPYILGARSDRKFEDGGNNYLKDVICPVINSLGFKSVTCIDPHSDVLEACIKGFRKESNLQLVKYCLNELVDKRVKSGKSTYLSDCILVSPDAGASKKIYKLAEKIGYKGDIITCSKDRDTDGKLSKTVVPIDVFPDKKDFIVVDDIGDGFGTFVNIVKEIKSKYPHKDSKFYLIVTHSIQKSGILKALEYYDVIYTTNSVNDFNINNLKQLNIF